MKKDKVLEFLEQSPKDFKDRCEALAEKFFAMTTSDEYKLLLEFQTDLEAFYISDLERVESYEEWIRAKANLDAIRRAKLAPITLADIIKQGFVSSSAEGNSPEESRD